MKKQWYSVKITFGVNDVYFDQVVGLNADDALAQAQSDWEGGKVEIVSAQTRDTRNEKTIEVYKKGGMWVAKFNNDPEIVDILGTNILPTAFTEKASAGLVFEEIQLRNPDCNVIVYEN